MFSRAWIEEGKIERKGMKELMADFLIVEDDSELRVRLCELLNFQGHNAIGVGEGRSAWQLLDEKTFDILILDWDLPDTTGLEICQHYRKSGGRGAVLLLSGRVRTNDKVAGLRAGADDYLTKPFVVAEMLARVEALLRRSKSGEEERLDQMVGKTFMEKYEMLSVIGRGGMGMVYKAKHIALNRTLAIKVMLNTRGLQGGAMKRFEREARAMSMLNHPNLVGITDFGTSIQGHPYIVMEYLQGRTLQDELEPGGGLFIARAVPIFVQIADALFHAHERGIIHRDLKPSNVMLLSPESVASPGSGNGGALTPEAKDRVKIVDLGLVKFTNQMENISQGLTYDGEIFGSPYYMSPEQAMGGLLDPRSDIYSLGCLMFQVLTGIVPLAGTTFMETISKRLTTEPPRIRDTCPVRQFPKSLESIVQKAMSRDKEDRFASMNELKLQLLTVNSAETSAGGFLAGLQGIFKKKNK